MLSRDKYPSLVWTVLIIAPLTMGATQPPGYGTGCYSRTVTQTNDAIIAQQQEAQQKEASAQVPPPAIVNWTEKRQLKLIQEARDDPHLLTYIYTKNLNGEFTWICDAFGFGLPYDTRSNNPNHYEFVSTTTGPQNNCLYTDSKTGGCVHGALEVMPQPEPNGLHIPPGAKGTWNMCINPATGKAEPAYHEQDLAVYPYPLDHRMVVGFNPHANVEYNFGSIPAPVSPTAPPVAPPDRR